MKTRKFNLRTELDRLGGWSAYGGVWRSFKGTTGTRTPDCTAEQPCLRTAWYSFGGDDQKVAYEYVSYTVSNGHAVVVQGLDDPFRARLIASAPDLMRFIQKIANGEAETLAIVGDAKALIKELRVPVAVYGRHDMTLDSEVAR